MRFITRRAATVIAAAMLTGLAASAATADDHVSSSTVTQSIAPGSLTAGLTNLALEEVGYSHVDQQSAGAVTLTVDDSSATGAGWNVSIESSAFVYDGDHGGEDIADTNFALTSAEAPTTLEGQAIDGDAVRAVAQAGSLDQARVVIEADADNGQGEYSQQLGVELTVPGQARAGTYTGTVTTTATAGPTTP